MKYIDTKLVAPIVLIALILAAVASITQGGVGGVPCTNFAITGSEVKADYLGDSTHFELFNTTLCGTQGHAYIISVSAESILVTDTKVKSKDMVEGFDMDMASIRVYVLVNDTSDKDVQSQKAFPSEVIFEERMQFLSAKLQGEVVGLDESGNPVLGDAEEIRLMLNTTSANTFNFLLTDLKSTVYNVKVMAYVVTDEESTDGSGIDDSVMGVVGDRTLVVQEVRIGQNYGLPDY